MPVLQTLSSISNQAWLNSPTPSYIHNTLSQSRQTREDRVKSRLFKVVVWLVC